MNQSDEFHQLLVNALNISNEIRQNAEETINKLASDNFGLFLLNLSLKLCNEQIEPGIRQLASTIIKNLILKDTAQWLSLNQDLKNKIKEHVLSTLASQLLDIRKAAAFTIAGICKVELPLNQWTEIFTVLVSTSNNENRCIQLSSLTALGFIFQEISPGNIDETNIANLLNSFYTILNKDSSNEEVINTALCAINRFLPFISAFLADKTQKRLFFELIRKYITHQNEELRRVAITIFLDLSRSAYDAFEDYIDELTEFTEIIIKQDKEPNAILCFEIWCSIGEIEISKLSNSNSNCLCLNLCEKESAKLLPLIFSRLLVPEHNQDEWTSRKGAETLLSILSQCCSYSVIKSVIQFIGENINSDSFDKKQAALSAFQSILDTSHKTEMSQLVLSSLDLILSFLTHPSSPNYIRELSAYVIQTIAQHYTNRIINEPVLFDRLFTTVLEQIDGKLKKMVIYLCSAISFICKGLPKDSNLFQTNLLSKYLDQAFSKLLSKSVQKESFDHNHNIAMNCFTALSTLIEKAALDTEMLKLQLLQQLFNAFQSTLSNEPFHDNEMRYSYQTYISFSFLYFIRSMSLHKTIVLSMFELILNSFVERNAVYEEGVQAMGSIAVYLGEGFTELIPKVINYVLSMLQNSSDASLCKKGILFCSEIITSVKNHFTPYGDSVIPLIITILSNPDIEKELKLYSFNVISDYFFYCPNAAIKFFKSIMTLIGSALQAALTLPQNDEDLSDYFRKLREHLLETITIIFGVLVDLGKTNEFTAYVGQIVTFINTVNSDEYSPPITLYKESLGLLADFSKAYVKDMKPLLEVRLIEKMINALKASSNDKLIGDLISYSQKTFSNTFSN